MNPDKQPVNFYFGSLKDSNVLSETKDKHQDYIILQNDFLHKKVEDLQTELFEVRKELEELTEDNESLELSKTSLKGYVQNQGNYSKMSKRLVEHYNQNLSKISKLNDQYVWQAKVFAVSYIVLEICILIMKLYNREYTNFIMCIMIDCFLYYCIKEYFLIGYKNLISIKDVENHHFVMKIKEEMKEAEKGNDFLGDLIDLV